MRQTEQNSLYQDLEKMSTAELLEGINAEDRKVPEVVAGSIPQIARLVDGIVERMERGGRVFYIGAGTSGRLGITDASEILPTYGLDGAFIGIIAGGDGAIRRAVEGAEDNPDQGWKDAGLRSEAGRYCRGNQRVRRRSVRAGRSPQRA